MTNTKKIVFSVIASLLLVGLYGSVVFGAFSGYTPGETLNPECEPGSEYCVVNLPEGGGTATPAGDHGQLQFNYDGSGDESGGEDLPADEPSPEPEPDPEPENDPAPEPSDDGGEAPAE